MESLLRTQAINSCKHYTSAELQETVTNLRPFPGVGMGPKRTKSHNDGRTGQMRIGKTRTLRNVALLMAAAFFVLLPCSPRVSGSGGSGDTTTQTLSQQRQKYQKDVEEELQQLRHEIDALQAKAPKNSDTLRKDFDQQMAELKRKRNVAEQKYDTIEKSSQKAWQDMKPGLDAAVRDLQEAYRRAASEFK